MPLLLSAAQVRHVRADVRAELADAHATGVGLDIDRTGGAAEPAVRPGAGAPL